MKLKSTYPIKRVLFSRNMLRKSRFLAFVSLFVVLAIILLQYFSFVSSSMFVIKSNVVIFFALLLLVVQPRLLQLWGLIGFIIFFVNIYVGGNLLGLFFYCGSLLVLLKIRFFKSYIFLKNAGCVLIFVSAFAFQYYNWGFGLLKVSILNIVVVLFLIIFLIVVFEPDLKKYYSQKESYSLSQLNLSDRQRECFILAVQGLPYKEISKKIFVSESVVKKEMLEIYHAMNVKSYAEFLVFIEKYDIVD